jgi:hypothetical protein
MSKSNLAPAVILLALCPQLAVATPSHVSIDLSGLGGSNLQLQAALFDNSGVIGDSWARIDNVVLGTAVDDFETGTLGGFDGSLNPASVLLASGSLNGTGSHLMRIDEDPVVTPTIAFRNYSVSSNILAFDLELATSGTLGPMGQDELVFSLLNSATLDPLVPGLTGVGDVLVVNASSIQHTNSVAVTTTQIPAPAALVLGLVGLGCLNLWHRRLRSL